MACETRQENDEMVCRCGLRWAISDSDPPTCQKNRRRRPGPPAGVEERREVAAIDVRMPLALSETLALELAQHYENRRVAGLGGIEAMRATYRLLLDRLS
jgi:hypothetical protein